MENQRKVSIVTNLSRQISDRDRQIEILERKVSELSNRLSKLEGLEINSSKTGISKINVPTSTVHDLSVQNQPSKIQKFIDTFNQKSNGASTQN